MNCEMAQQFLEQRVSKVVPLNHCSPLHTAKFVEQIEKQRTQEIPVLSVDSYHPKFLETYNGIAEIRPHRNLSLPII